MPSRTIQNLFVIIIAACGIVTNIGCSKRSDLEKSLIGKWENIGLHVTIHTYHNTDSTVIMDFDEEDLRTRFPLKPMVTVLNEDGTYYLEYRTKSDSLVARPSGKWSLKGDSIIMHQYVPNESSFSYHVTMMPDRAEFRGLLDYDADGKVDDEMIALSKKIETH
jgi:hypothetical protein